MPLENIYMPSNDQSAQSQPQPQPQLHAMLPPASKQNEVRKYTAEDWDAQGPEIIKQYERGTLDGVVKYMRAQHGLDATYETTTLLLYISG
jgi:hypothetical protein